MTSQTRHSIFIQTLSVSRPLSFIRLVNYLVASTMHNLVVSAVAKLLALLQERVRLTPSHSLIESWGQQPEATTGPAEEDMQRKVGLLPNYYQ